MDLSHTRLTRSPQIAKLAFRTVGLLASLGLILTGRVTAQTFTNLHGFTNGIGGASPQGSLILSSNTLFGTTTSGGSYGNGIVFKINTDGIGFSNLFNFNAVTNGAAPFAGLILSSNTLYGTTSAGGLSGVGAGTVFKVNTNGTGFTNLHSFTPLLGDNPPYYNSDGGVPHCKLILSSNVLYGTTTFGGSLSNGTVFKVNTDGTGFTILHSFAGSPSDGGNPNAGLILSGNTLYGTTQFGGTNNNNAGMVFAVNTDGTGYTNLHSLDFFGDGANPQAGLTLSSNTLYGTTQSGGGSFSGTIFRLNTNGTSFTTLHSFGSGSQPYAGLILSSNTLYGTLRAGGVGYGMVFAITTNGTSFTNLYSFTNGSDGANPYADLILSSNALFGTTYNGGNSGKGTVFRLSFAAVTVPVAPDIAVFDGVGVGGNERQNNVGTFTFSNTIVGGSITQTFTIKNAGNTNLTGLALTNTGPNPADFILGALGATTLISNATTSFTVAFSPTAGGTRSAVVQIASNDGDENPFVINLTGTSAQITATPTLLTTFTNPTPATSDYFGVSVASMGSDRVLIGAYSDNTGATDAGAAYLYSTNGTLLNTFTNPTPATGDRFGYAVAAVGNDRIIIGAYADGALDAGAAYLFSTNGSLITTFTNPIAVSNAAAFGFSVAGLGSDRVLIGALWDDTGAIDAGAVYLYSTNGNLLTTFTNPAPENSDSFGNSIAVVGSDRVLIGASSDDTGYTDTGAAYLFSTNGTLLTTFTNPPPVDSATFGSSVAAVGGDRVLIGANQVTTGATLYNGAAYLFNVDGTLLTTFTNPTPASFDNFGLSVAAVGSDKLLIGAYSDNTGATDAGAVYLYSTNGTLLNTFTNPTPATGDYFGYSVAAVGRDRIIIGAYLDGTGAANAGAAYLFAIPPDDATAPPPKLQAQLAAGMLTFQWPTNYTGYAVQATATPGSSNSWANVTATPAIIGSNYSLTFPTTNASRFFRLRSP